MKCVICKETIPVLFLEKIKGTFFKKQGSSKKYSVCFACQKKYKTKEEILKHF